MSLPKGKTTKKTEENTMTRFERELSGALGAYWKASAEKELAEIKADLENGIDCRGATTEGRGQR